MIMSVLNNDSAINDDSALQRQLKEDEGKLP